MTFYALSLGWFLLAWMLRLLIVDANERNIYDMDYARADASTRRMIRLASIITLSYFPAVAMSFYYLYWAFVGTLTG